MLANTPLPFTTYLPPLIYGTLMCRPYSHFARPDFAPTYMLLGITLAKLDDSQNAIAAFEKAVEINR